MGERLCILACARRLFEDLFARLATPVAVVFDNYQAVPNQAPVHDVLAQGLSVVPAGVSVIVLSRANPPPALARLQAEQRMALIEEDDLWLTEGEATSLVTLQARTNRKPVPRQIRAQLVRQSQGWVAGLVLLLEQLKTRRALDHASELQSPEVLFDYLAREVLKQLDPETQGFLLKSAVLPVMTVAMAERLTGLATAGDVLTRLYRARYFTERRVEGQPWYQYHPLFREFLLGRSQAGLPAGELNTLQRTAATLLADAGRTEDAVQLWQEAGAHDEVIALILAQAPMLLAQGRGHTLEGWLRDLPPESLEQNPWLLFWLASCRLPSDPKDSRMLFERALQRFTATHDRSGSLLAWCGVIESIAYAWDEAIDVDERLAEFKRLTQGESEFPSAEIEAREANTKLIEFIGLVIRADRALKRDDEAGGLVALRAGLAIGAETEFFYPMLPGRSAWPLLCATALERRTEAIGVYHRCRKALADHLGTPPSTDLERAYAALHAHRQG